MGKKSELRRGASHSGEMLVDDTYGCEVQSHKSLSKKLNGGGRERDSQVADLSFKNCSLGPKTAIFGPKKP